MATSVQTLREERVAIFERMKTVLDKAEAESRPLSGEERAEYDKMEKDLEAKEAEVEALEGDDARRARAAEIQADMARSRGRKTSAAPVQQPAGGDGGSALGESLSEALERLSGEGLDRRQAFAKLAGEYTAQRKDAGRAISRFCSHGWNGLRPEEKAALQVDVDTTGGTLVVGEEFVARLIKFVDDRLYMRGICTVLPLTDADNVGVPSLEADPADADWTSELLIGGEDSTMATGKRKLHPNPLAKLIRVSRTLLRKSAIPAETLVRERLGYKFAVTEEKGFLTGTGASQPLGVFTASAQGITTARDVSSGNTTTTIGADGLINCKFSLKSQYMASPSTRWIFHRTAVRDIRKLKDGNGQYLWQAGLAGTPDMILEVPYLMSEFAPSTFTTGLYVGIIGDFTWYWIAESLRFELQRLDELYAATNQVGFVGRLELDAMPVLNEAFARVTLA